MMINAGSIISLCISLNVVFLQINCQAILLNVNITYYKKIKGKNSSDAIN